MNLITASLADEYCLSHSATKLAEQPSEKWELAEFEPYSRHWDFVSLSYADDICLASRFVKLRIWKCECLCPRMFVSEKVSREGPILKRSLYLKPN